MSLQYNRMRVHPFQDVLRSFTSIGAWISANLFSTTSNRSDWTCNKSCVGLHSPKQGDFITRSVKLQLPSCSWFLIKNAMTRHGIESLTWVLGYRSLRHTGILDVWRFDSEAKLVAFRELFGQTCGFGVRKKRPKYSESQSLLSINDVINVVSFEPNEQPGISLETAVKAGGRSNAALE